MDLIKEIENLFIDNGYHLKVIGTTVINIQKDQKEVYEIKLYLDSGDGFGSYYIPRCDHCFEDADIVIWIKEQFQELYPELF